MIMHWNMQSLKNCFAFCFLFIFCKHTGFAQTKNDTISYIQIVHIQTKKIDTLLKVNYHLEAPNWHSDNYLLVNSYGKLYKVPMQTPTLQLFNTGTAHELNNDHGISPDKKWLAISHNNRADTSKKPYHSAIYIVPIEGGEPKLITQYTPSYWHGWSPDGKILAYCAERNNQYDIYTIPVEGGKETQLTSTLGLDDGPEYSPDSKYIYFNSYRTGHMQIWRMLADGSHPEQLTFDENSNWFAHPSPDNQWIVYIAYLSDEQQSHLFGKTVQLKLMHLATKTISNLTAPFFGGQGSINVPSWSPDSQQIAFVRYAIQSKYN